MKNPPSGVGSLGIVALLALCGCAMAATAEPSPAIYVAANGNDAAPGTFDQPVATLTRAQALVRPLIQRGSPAPSVIIGPGRYELRETLEFTAADAPAIWQGKPDTIISGGRQLPAWRVVAGAFVTEAAALPAGTVPRLLLIGDRRAIRARHPNTVDPEAADAAFFTGLEPVKKGDFADLRFPVGQLGAWATGTGASDVEFVSLLEWSYHRHRLARANVDLSAQRIGFPTPVLPLVSKPWATFLHGTVKGSPYYFENARAFLDAPGEWWCDPATRQVRYLPQPGEQPTVPGVVAALPTLLRITGTPQAPVRGLTFVNLTFRDAAWTPPADGFKPGQAGFVGSASAATLSVAIHLSHAHACSFAACTFAHLDGNGIAFDRGCQGGGVERSTFVDIGGNALDLGDRITPKDPAQPHPVSAIAVRDCRLSRIAFVHPGCVGIWAGLVREVVIERNELRDMPYSGISLGWRWSPGPAWFADPTFCGGNRVEANRIHRVCLWLSDGGGIYTLGNQPGTVIRGNAISDIPHRFGSAGTHGIFADEGTSEVLIAGNAFWNISEAAIRFHKAAKNRIDGNRIFGKALAYAACKATDMDLGSNDIRAGTPPDIPALCTGTGPK